VTDFSVRVLAEAEWRDAASMFRGAMHCPPPSDEEWAASKQSIEPGRYLGVVTEGRVLGTTFAFTSAVAVPGGAVLPMAAVTRVGVRADHTRRGMLTDLMRAQLADATARGEVFAGLIASEPGIYGRFGFGIGTRHRTLHIRGGRVGPEVPAAGQIRIVTGDEAVELLPQLYRRIGLSRPGMISRPSHWWAAFAARSIRTAEPNVVAVHSGPDGDDGFVTYQSKRAITTAPQWTSGSCSAPPRA
jgi:predicted acetyltransferase